MVVMSIQPITLSIIILILGIVHFLVGRTMKTHAEEEWKEEYWWRELIYGPPGYYRASSIVLGIVFMVTGGIGVVYALFIAL